MKILKRRLLPLLTCLIAVAAILLPPHISQAKDAQLMDGVHAETLAEDRLCLQESTLSQRIKLLYLWMTNGKISALTQPVSEDEMNTDILPAAETALDGLFQKVTTIADAIPFMPEITSGSRLFLRTASGLSASMILLQGGQWGHAEFTTEVVIDEQTGRVLSFTLECAQVPEGYSFGIVNPFTCAQEYSNYIGMDVKGMTLWSNMAIECGLSGCDVTYMFFSDGQTISIQPFGEAAGFY